jgi:hypothetical protein
VAETKFLGMVIYNHTNRKRRVNKILPKLSVAGFVIWKLFHILNLLCEWYTLPIFIQLLAMEWFFWGKFNYCMQSFQIKKKLSVMETRSSCRGV